MSDLIDRKNAIDVLQILADKMTDEGRTVMAQAISVLRDLSSVKPDMDEWCTECKEYDKEKHCCPRWNKVIRQTVEEMQMMGKIAKVIEHDASINTNDGYKYYRTEYIGGKKKKKVIGGDEYCSHCGARLEWK